MAKKKKKRKRNKRPAASKAANSPATGKKFLSQGQFSQAIKIFRRQYKETGDEQWLPLLRAAFSGRISQLTAKGMYKEALVIYQNAEALFPDYSLHLHIFLLTLTGKIDEAAQAYRTADNTLAKKQKQAVDESLAALLLSGQEKEKLLAALPENSAIRLHYSHADRALQAYSLKQDAEVLANLQKIPFRSPYKNFRLALKGMVVFHSQPDKATSFFEKIDHKSPFYRMTLPYRHLLAGKNEQGKTEKLSFPDKKVVQSLVGLNRNTVKFLETLKSHSRTPSALYHCLVTSGKCLGRKRLRKICYRLLPHLPEKFSDFSRRFGSINDDFEARRLNALSMEIEDCLYGVAEAWEETCNELIRKNKAENHLKIALIYRHIAEVMEKSPEKYGLNEILEKLEKSLAYDPGDKETYLQIFHLLRPSPARQYRHLNQMLELFPDDPDILLLGVEAAVRRGAFKKASRLAAKLLEKDPINTKARQLLINAHLNHAHKLSGMQKYELACRECETAASFDRANLGRGTIEICHGLLKLLAGDTAAGRKFLAAGESKAESQALAHFRIYIEAHVLALPKKWLNLFAAQFKTTLRSSLDQTTLLQVINEIANLDGARDTSLKSIRPVLAPWFKKGATFVWSRENIRHFCRTFHGKKYYDLLLAYAKAGTKRQPDDPLMQFYLICAKTGGGKKRLTKRQYKLLDRAWYDAKQSGDKEAAGLIDAFLIKHSPFTESIPSQALQMMVDILGEKYGEHIANGTEPTDDELDAVISEVLSEGPLPNGINPSHPPRKEQPPKNRSATPEKETDTPDNNPTQLNLFP